MHLKVKILYFQILYFSLLSRNIRIDWLGEKIIKKFDEARIFRNMRKQINAVGEKCYNCLCRNEITVTIHPALGQTDIPMYSFSIVTIDTACPLTPSPSDAGASTRHIVILIEPTTWFLVLAKLKYLAARSICDFLS